MWGMKRECLYELKQGMCENGQNEGTYTFSLKIGLNGRLI
jgi:hypothetical protein